MISLQLLVAVSATTSVHPPWNAASTEDSLSGEITGKRLWMASLKHLDPSEPAYHWIHYVHELVMLLWCLSHVSWVLYDLKQKSPKTSINILKQLNDFKHQYLTSNTSYMLDKMN